MGKEHLPPSVTIWVKFSQDPWNIRRELASHHLPSYHAWFFIHEFWGSNWGPWVSNTALYWVIYQPLKFTKVCVGMQSCMCVHTGRGRSTMGIFLFYHCSSFWFVFLFFVFFLVFLVFFFFWNRVSYWMWNSPVKLHNHYFWLFTWLQGIWTLVCMFAQEALFSPSQPSNLLKTVSSISVYLPIYLFIYHVCWWHLCLLHNM